MLLIFCVDRTKDNKKLETCEAMEVVHDVPNETYKLIIHCVELSDEGYYRVTAKNKLGEDYKEARLKTISKSLTILLAYLYLRYYYTTLTYSLHLQKNRNLPVSYIRFLKKQKTSSMLTHTACSVLLQLLTQLVQLYTTLFCCTTSV